MFVDFGGVLSEWNRQPVIVRVFASHKDWDLIWYHLKFILTHTWKLSWLLLRFSDYVLVVCTWWFLFCSWVGIPWFINILDFRLWTFVKGVAFIKLLPSVRVLCCWWDQICLLCYHSTVWFSWLIRDFGAIVAKCWWQHLDLFVLHGLMLEISFKIFLRCVDFNKISSLMGIFQVCLALWTSGNLFFTFFFDFKLN